MERYCSTFLQEGPAEGKWRWPGHRTWRRSRGGTRGQRYFMSMNLIAQSPKGCPCPRAR